jgi:transcriptional regulator with XRE-family HTH domain
MSYLAILRDQRGIGSNVELAERVRARGNLPTFNASAMSKWGPRVQPSIETLREIAYVVGVPPLDLFLRAEVLQPEDISERPVPPVYRDLIDLDRDIEYYASKKSGLDDVFAEERDRLQDHIIGLVQLTRDKVRRLAETARIAQPPRRRRSPKSANGK